jgi:hypothetical protein
VAAVLVERGTSAVLDLSTMSRAGQRRFATAFAERFYELKRQHRSPVHLVVEEAQGPTWRLKPLRRFSTPELLPHWSSKRCDLQNLKIYA